MNDPKNSVSLGELVTHKKGFAFKSSKFETNGVPVVKVTNFTDSSVSTSDLVYVSESHAEENKSFKLNSGDIVIQTVGSWPNNPASVVGKVVMIPSELDKSLLNQNAVILYPRESLNRRFLFYLLKDRSFKGYIINTAQGAANQASITLDSIFRFQFFRKPLPTQRKIAAILTTYDDLIDTNKRRIALLEKMAEELYREWFVRMRFPGYQNTKFVKGVPHGWEIRPISSFCEEIRAGVKKKDLADDEIYIGLEHIPRKSIAFKEWATADSVDSNKLRFKERDILFSKIRPYLHKVGVAHFSGACSSDTIVLRPCDQIYEGFLLFTVFSDTFIELATVAAKGTKMPRADWAFLEKLELKIPPSELLEVYQSRFEEIFALIATLLKANRQATETRDLLLPRLISGKLSVEDLDIQFPPNMWEEVTELEHAHA